MRFSKAAGVMAGLSLLALAPAASGQSLSRRMDLLKMQEEAVNAAMTVFQSDGKACAGQFPALKTAFDDPRFDRLEAGARRPVLYAVMMCAEAKDLPLAVAAARKLQPLAEEPMEVVAVYSVQISDALQRGETAEGARLFLTLSDLQPEAVAGWDPEMVGPFADYIDGEPELSLKLAERIVKIEWTNAASKRAAANEWALAYGWQLADRGKNAEAGKAVAGADDLYVMMIVAGDRRFSSVWNSRRFDWTALAEADLARAGKSMQDSPQSLRPVEEYISAARALGRYDEAIQVGQAFRARLQDGEEFDDGDYRADNMLISLAQALFETGDYKEAEAVFVQAIGDDPDGSAIDARIAWAGRLLDLARPAEALKLMDGIDREQTTPYGRLWVDSQRACAQSDIDRKAAETTLETLRKGKGENPAALSQALICMNQLDEAAALMVTRLADPKHRAGALDPYWVTRAPPKTPAWLVEFERRRQAMLNRPEVLAALDKAGRKVEAPLAGDYWGGF